MRLMKCINNHYYDGDVYSKCPHCKEEMDEIRTEKLDARCYGVDIMSKHKSNDDLWESNSQDFEQPTSMNSAHKESEEKSAVDLRSTIENLNMTEKPEYSSNGFDKDKLRKATVAFHTSNVPDDECKTVSFSGRQEDAKEPLVGWLVGLNGEVYGEGFPLVTGRNYIGRGADMDVVLRGDPSVSRNKHAIIIYDPKNRQFLVQPGESKELFYLNDKVVLDTLTIINGSVLCIGETKLKFVALCGEDFSWETNA